MESNVKEKLLSLYILVCKKFEFYIEKMSQV
jgi:hypothetical protein